MTVAATQMACRQAARDQSLVDTWPSGSDAARHCCCPSPLPLPLPSSDLKANVEHGVALVRRAAAAGANIVLLQELFESLYFCQDQLATSFDLAKPLEDNPLIQTFQALAKELRVVLPISFFERAGVAHFNSVAVRG